MQAAEQAGPVLVTGASRRIGLALAQGFARAGRPVVLARLAPIAGRSLGRRRGARREGVSRAGARRRSRRRQRDARPARARRGAFRAADAARKQLRPLRAGFRARLHGGSARASFRGQSSSAASALPGLCRPPARGREGRDHQYDRSAGISTDAAGLHLHALQIRALDRDPNHGPGLRAAHTRKRHRARAGASQRNRGRGGVCAGDRRCALEGGDRPPEHRRRPRSISLARGTSRDK